MMILLAAVCVGFASCGDDDDNGGAIPAPDVVVQTISESAIAYSESGDEVSLSADLVPEGGRAVLTATPSVKTAAMTIITGVYDETQGKYIFDLSGLAPSTVYTIMVTIYNSAGNAVRQSEAKTITTPETSGSDTTWSVYSSCPNGHHPHAIDLGLPSRTMWACHNVGAASPIDEGEFYKWGETEAKTNYQEGIYDYWEETYIDGNEWSRNAILTRGVPGIKILKDLGDEIGGTEYDVAHVKWAGAWRMPTTAQIEELISSDNTTAEWVHERKDGVWITGWRFVSKWNNRKVFLPAAGAYTIANAGMGKYGTDGEGYYWTSERSVDSKTFSQYVYFNNREQTIGSIIQNSVLSVRPIRK